MTGARTALLVATAAFASMACGPRAAPPPEPVDCVIETTKGLRFTPASGIAAKLRIVSD